MNQSKLRSAVYSVWVLVGAGLVPIAAHSQAAKAATGSPKPSEEVIVTGTRIKAPNLTSTSPTQAVTSEDIKISGRNDVSDILLLLPQNFSNSLGQDLGNRTSGLTTAGGVSTADLRGLGPNRTLVLVNGRRLGSGSPNTAISSPAPDLDQIPAKLVERVDVVTGGQSAVYGSDAIAGVINFIMKKDFEGLELDAGYGFNYANQQSPYMRQAVRDFGEEPRNNNVIDGRTVSLSLLGGANTGDGRGNFTAFLGYEKSAPVVANHRDYGGCQLNKDTDDDGVPLGTASCGGSGNSNFFQPKSGPNGTDPTAIYSVFGTDFVDFGSEDTTPPAFFNSQKFIFMSRDDERYNAGVLGHYDVNDYVKPYIEFGFTNDRTHQEIAPSALFLSSNPLEPLTNGYLINCSNPLLSAQQRNILCSAQEILDDTNDPGTALANVNIGRRNVEGGGRSSDYEHTNYRAVLGATGDLAKAWSYDLYGQYYYTQFYNSNNAYLDFQKITNALQVGGTAQDPVCLTGPPCVPYNIFSDGGVTRDQTDYLSTAGTAYGTVKLGTLHVDVSGDLGDYGVRLPTASDGVGINVGYEKRGENQRFAPDAAENSGLLSGFGGAQVAIDRTETIKEFFGEVRVPLIQDAPGVADLNVDAGYRRSDYATSGQVSTYKFGVQYVPVVGARVRGSYQRAIRAPSLIELFNPQSIGQIEFGADPCAPTLDTNNNLVAATASLAECLNTVSAAQAAAFTAAYGNGGTTNQIPQGTAAQLAQVQGGNPDLKPEVADTYSLGITFTPELVPHFTGSIDYFLIKLDKAVDSLPSQVIVSDCLATGNPNFCSQIVRAPNTFGLNGASVTGGGYILQTSLNTGGLEVSGIDLQADYDLELPSAWGSVDFTLAGSYLLENKTTPYDGAHTYDCAGLFGATCETVNPIWHHIFRTSWRTPWDLDASLTWRFIGAVKQDNNDSDETLRFSSYPGIDTFNAEIGSRTYFDLAATYHPMDNVEVRAGINNILDRAPPLVTTEIIAGGTSNTYETYDLFGRQIFIGATMKL